jgi:hypothetical protein
MNRTRLKNLSADQLVTRFVALAIDQGVALLDHDTAKISRLYWEIDAIENELKARPGDLKSMLLPLYDHPDLQVCLKAAIATLAIAPQQARGQLEEIKAAKIQPQALDAGMTLWNLDQGIFKPT